MFQSFAALSWLGVWSALPVAQRATSLRGMLAGVLAKPDIIAAIREALPEPARKPFSDFVRACESEWRR